MVDDKILNTEISPNNCSTVNSTEQDILPDLISGVT